MYLQAEALKAVTMRLLNEKLHPDVRVKPAEVDRAIEDMVLAGKIVRSKDRFYQRNSLHGKMKLPGKSHA